MDDAQYSLDQLLLGTLMFSTLVFLFPTVAVYYLLFSLCRLWYVSFIKLNLQRYSGAGI